MISVILGTRPEIIKMSPIVRELESRGFDHHVIHTGQHYSYEMDRIFFEELELLQPEFNLDVGSGSQGDQTGRMLPGIEKILIEEKSDLVLVQGDTNTVLAGAMAASKLHIPIGHVEAGLRSYDRRMPEEINRVLTDHISTHLYAPTEESRKNLEKEGITDGVFVTGNTVVDSAVQNLQISKGKRDALARMNLQEKGYLLATAHRQENVDSKERLSSMILGFNLISEEFGLPLIFPAHPRTQKMLEKFKIDMGDIDVIDPIGYLDFLQLEQGAKLILTDSGGLQEEGCILGTPCVTLRENTERPETLQVGANVLAGTDPERILEAARKMVLTSRGWENPYGDGQSAKRIVELATELLYY